MHEVNYFITTFPLDTNRKGVTIGSKSLDSSRPTFHIRKLSFNNSIINEVNSGQVEITYEGFQNTNFYSYIKEGDCLRIFEVFGTTPLDQNQAVVFTGYVASIRHDLDDSAGGGLRTTLFFYNFLGQWNNQATLNSLDQQLKQKLTNLNSNKIPLGQVLSELVQGSLFQKFIDLGLFSITSQNYQGQKLPVRIGNSALTLDSLVWTYISTSMTKMKTLQKVLFPYQFIFYQEPTGILVLDLLRPARLTNSLFTFSDSHPDISSRNFSNVQITKSACMVPNKVISTMVNLPFFPPENGVPENFIASMENPFTRPSQLQESGYFELLQVDDESINDSMITDPTLLAFLAGGVADTGYSLSTLSGKSSIAATYSARRLAQVNLQETGMVIRQPRAKAAYAGNTPLGYLVNVNFPGMLDEGENSLYCHSTITEFDINSGATFTMQLMKHGAVTAYWDNP